MVTVLPPGRPAALAMEGGPGQRAATEPSWPEQPDCSPELKLSARSLAGAVGRRSLPPTPASSHNSLLVRAVVLLCLAGALQGILVNGLINVVISTIEKRFGIRSTDTGLIASSYDIASFICLLPVSYLGGRGSGSKPRWIGAGMAVMGLGSLIFSLPHLTASPPARQQEDTLFCNASRAAEVDEVSSKPVSDKNYKFVFMLAQLLHGAGAAPIYTLGVTYIDENIGARNSATFLGVFYTMAVVGPAIGYGLGGQLLNVPAELFPELPALSLTPGDPGWVGAWWLGFVVCGAGGLVLAWPLAALPASLPGTQEPPADQACRSRLSSHASFRSSLRSRPVSSNNKPLELAAAGPLPVGRELLTSLGVLLTNPTFIFVSLAGATEGFLMTGLATFLPKMIENQFSLTASEAALNVGTVSVVAGGGGTLLGGLVVKRYALRVPGLLKMTSVTQLLAILFSTGLLAQCTTSSRGSAAAACTVDCNCNASAYSPVCAGDYQMDNACEAGCTARQPGLQGLFINCSCSAQGTAVPGPCPQDCPLMYLFLGTFFVTMLITFMANMPTLTVTLRCVDPTVRSLALGIQWLMVRLLGTIPGPVAMGKLFDNACEKWKYGQCFVYNGEEIAKSVLTLFIVCKTLTIVYFLAGVRFYKLPEDEESPESVEKEDTCSR